MIRRSLALRLYVAMLFAQALIVVSALFILLLIPRLPGLFPARADERVARAISLDLGEYLDDRGRLQERVLLLSRELDVSLSVERRGQILASAGDDVDPGASGFVAMLRAPVALPVRGTDAVVVVVNRLHLRFPIRGVIIILLSAVLVAGVLFRVTRTITRPLRRLAEVADALGRDATPARTGIDSEDEVGRVARAFDAMAERIEGSRRVERELIANVSHEVRTPIARVRMALALVDSSEPEVARRLSVVESELRELETLVSRLMEAVRFDDASLPLHPTNVGLRLLLMECEDRLRVVAPDRRLELNVSEELSLDADRELLARVFDNLLDNAHKYDATGGTITVDAVTSGGQVRVTVRDRGAGISAEDRERVFRAFYRGADARAQSASGFGIGLALARRIVVAHGGSIQVADQAGGGTAMEVALPLNARRA